jgi:hypothetical protein
MNVLFCSLALMVSLTVPTATQTKEIARRFLSDLESFSFQDDVLGELRPVVCAVCDGAPTCAEWHDWVPLRLFQKMLSKAKMQKSNLSGVHSDLLLSHCTVDHVDLEDCVLSPKTVLNQSEEVMVCKSCNQHLEKSFDGKKSRMLPPPWAIFSGHLIGEAPVELSELSSTELALVSGGRIDCQSHVFFGGCHEQIRGWHTVFRNRVVANVSNLTMLRSSGLNGKIVVVLCGPFTTTQKALAKKQVQVDPAKVFAAFNWLKRNNHLFQNMELPNIRDIPVPILLEEDV